MQDDSPYILDESNTVECTDGWREHKGTGNVGGFIVNVPKLRILGSISTFGKIVAAGDLYATGEVYTEKGIIAAGQVTEGRWDGRGHPAMMPIEQMKGRGSVSIGEEVIGTVDSIRYDPLPRKKD